MKKNYTKLLLAVICLFTFSAVRAQTYTMGDITATAMPMMNHDSTVCFSSCNLVYTITINSSFLNDSVMVVDTTTASLLFATGNTTGASPWTVTVTIPIYNPTVGDDQIAGGFANFFGPVIKIVSGTDTIHSIPNYYSLYVPDPCTYASITGMVYADNNNDCVYNSGDIQLTGIGISGNETCTGSGLSGYGLMDYSSTGGMYNLLMQQSWLDSIVVTIPPYYSFLFFPSTCTSGSYSVHTLPQANLDFPVQCGGADLACWTGGPADVKPNRPFFMQPTVVNTGCDTASGVLTFIKDSRVTYDASLSTLPAVTVSGDTLTWNYTNLTNRSGGAYWTYFLSHIHLTPLTSVVIGDTLCFRVYTHVPATDADPTNNDYTICLPVVTAYDPNIKQVSPRGTGTAGNIPATTPELIYTIHFQNTGTASANDVYVVDTLNPALDYRRLRILSTSHSMTPMWVAPGVVKFNYYGINLPDSTSNEAASHGYVRFSVPLLPSLPIGTQIKNKGDIYFDFNPAITTNTTLNTIASNVGINTVAATPEVKIYPNPATDNIFVENLQNGQLSILSINGAVVLNQNITNIKTEIDISRLPAGVYILKTVSKDGASTRKFVKE